MNNTSNVVKKSRGRPKKMIEPELVEIKEEVVEVKQSQSPPVLEPSKIEEEKMDLSGPTGIPQLQFKNAKPRKKSAYNDFMSAEFKNPDYNGLSPKEKMRKIAQKWSSSKND